MGILETGSRSDAPDPLGDDTWSGCESLIRAFEEAWKQGKSPEIENYLHPDESRRLLVLRELMHVDLEFRIKAGQQTCVEWYLEHYPELAVKPDVVLDLIAAEYEFRRRREQDLSASDYQRRFPAFGSLIGRRLQIADRTAGGMLLGPASLAEPLNVPGYEIIAKLGRGGMGIVYQAIEARLGRYVALKFIPPELARDESRLQRFNREAQTASGLNHPHICTVHALGEHDGAPFIVMEFIEGQTLKALAADGLTVIEACRLVRQAAGALAAAHQAGIVHRDIKPENLMVRPDGYIKVLDFGLARRLPTLAPNAGPADHDTWPGVVMGTVNYMSPEQAKGLPLDGASDVFSLGVVLYWLVSGEHPFDRGASFDTMHAIANSCPAPVTRINPEIPVALERLIEAMLHKDPRLRPMAAEVEQTLAGIVRSGRAAREPTPRRIVHREQELHRLRDALATADGGRGSIMCLAGEPGIGKTTLVEDFLDELATRGNYQLARGRCSERQAAVSAYLPIVDALADLVRSETGSAVARLLRVVAPSWFAQLSVGSRAGAPPPPVAFSQQAMLRELASLLTAVSRLGTVVLFVDDVHWADISTVDLLAYIARHCHTLPVLIVATYRPTELLLGPHPFHRVKLDLQGQGICSEVAVNFFGRSQVEDYLSLAFPGHAFPGDFADLIHSRTEGSPLFMADLLRYLRERGVIAEMEGRWQLARELPDIWQELPETIRSMIQRKLERLATDDQRLLSVAAAQGHQFDSAVVAEAALREPAEVEERLQELDRVHGLVRLMHEDEFPDYTPTLRYSFVHVLYQQALFTNLLPTRRRAVNKALAEAWSKHLGDEPNPYAAELACLYEVGHEPIKAARQFYLAAQHAGRVFAHRDALALARRGLGLLEELLETPARIALERPLQTLLGLQLQVTEGYAARSAEVAYERARELCGDSDEEQFPILWGLWLVRKVRSELPRAQELAQNLLDIARRRQAPDLGLQAHQALGLTALCRGRPTECLQHVEQVAALYDPQRHRLHAFQFGQDPGVICKAYGAIALWFLGHPESAVRESEAAIAMSQGHSPNSQSVALHFAAMVYQLCQDERRTRETAEACAALANEHGFPFWRAGSTIIGGWALADGGDVQAGLDRLWRGLDEWRATGSVTYLTYYYALLADALRANGDSDEALQVLQDALALTEWTDERFVESELYRLRGEIRTQSGAEMALAEADLRRALSIARNQQARSLELRAAISWLAFRCERGDANEARQLLRELVSTFPTSLNSHDLRRAKLMLNS